MSLPGKLFHGLKTGFIPSAARRSRWRAMARKIISMSDALQGLTDEELLARGRRVRWEAQAGVALDKLLPEAYSLIRESARRVLHMQHFEVQIMFTRNFANDVGASLQVGLAASAAARADHHGNAVGDGASKQQRQVTLHCQTRIERLAGAEVMRSGIRAATVHANHVGLSLERCLERTLWKSVTQNAAGRHHSYRADRHTTHPQHFRGLALKLKLLKLLRGAAL